MSISKSLKIVFLVLLAYLFCYVTFTSIRVTSSTIYLYICLTYITSWLYKYLQELLFKLQS